MAASDGCIGLKTTFTSGVRGGKNSSDWNWGDSAPSLVSASLAWAWMRSMILASVAEDIAEQPRCWYRESRVWE